MRLNKKIFCILFLMQFLIVTRQAVADELKNNEGVHFVFEYNNNSLSLRASEVSLAKILKQFCKETYVCPVIEGDLSEKVSFLFNEMSIEQALKRIVHGKSFIIIYTPLEKNKVLRSIKEFRVYGYSKVSAEPVSVALREKLARIKMIDTLADVDAIPELAEMLATENTSQIKMHLIQSLGNRGGESVVKILSAELGNNNVSVRKAVVHALGGIRNTESSLLLAQLLFSDPDPQLRKIVLEELSTFSILPAKYFLKQATQDKDEKVQQEAAYALEVWKFGISEQEIEHEQ